MNKPKFSFVIPCLNEELTLPFVLKKINKVIKELSNKYEIEVIVSDNGSTDNSLKIAIEHGAKVIPCEIKGYGAALDNGIRHASGEYIVFADADDTYDWLEAPLLMEKILSANVDMVIGSRLKGNIHKNAMPFLHRYLGTPLINWIINFLYSKKNKIQDANSGFRCFKKQSYLKWGIKSDGMEFASEMLIKALLHNAEIEHVPISLYPDKPGRKPHLKTWRDGMRHLLRILFYASHFFLRLGLGIFVIAWINLFIGFFSGKTLEFYNIRIYGFHSLVLFSFLSVIGLNIWTIGLFIATKQNQDISTYKILLNLSEEYLFFLLLFGLIIIFCIVGYLFWRWKENSFQFLNFERELIFFSSLSLSLILLSLNTLAAHILRRD